MTPSNPFIDLQKSYWTFNAAEKASLMQRYPAHLSWSERLRLHHLVCMELVQSGPAREALVGDQVSSETVSGETAELCKDILSQLIAPDSPYRPRYGMLWQLKEQDNPQRPPDLQGVLENPSLTHLGSLEYIRLNQQMEPLDIGFAAFDDVFVVGFSNPALYRAARIYFEDGRDEIVALPLLYGISWMTGKPYDTDGTMTRFIGHVELEGTKQRFGLGVGHQDLAVRREEGITLVGLGSLAQVMIALEMDDPRFEQKCRVRGLDPDQVRRDTQGQ
ncbi:MAG: hypothetical protein SF029_23370 [bacterium]|nr:hypothetical protein [bacterium]